MPEFLRNVQKIFREFVFKKGVIEFTTGEHELFVETSFRRGEKLWIHILDNSEPTCGYIDNDFFTTKQIEGGFVISAIIESNNRKVYWFVK